MRNYLQIASIALLGSAIPLLAVSRGLFFAAVVFSALIGLASLTLTELKHSIKNTFTPKFAIITIPLLAIIAISAYQGINFDYSMKKLKDILIIFTFISLLSVFLNAVSKERLDLCLKILSGLTVLNILLLCFDMFFASKEYLIAFHGIDNIGPGRVRYPASQIAVVAPLVFGYLYYIKSKKLLGCLFMAFVFLVVVSTGGRSALLSLLVGSGFMFMVMAIKSKRMNIKMLLVGVASFIVLFFVGLAGYKYVDKRGGKNEFDRRMTMNSKDLSAGRFDIWKFTWEESIKKPFLGVGVGGYRTLTKDPAVVLPAKNHPHNFVLEILVSVGFIGLLASLCILLYLFINYFTYGSGYGVFAMGSFVTYWVNSLTSVSIIQAYWITLFAVSFVIGYFTMKKEKA